jgi:hypothetical protein
VKAVGYIRSRASAVRGGDRFLSSDLQPEQIDAVARQEGPRIVEILGEFDASGGDALWPPWNEAIRRVEAGGVGAIAVWNLSSLQQVSAPSVVSG